MKGALARESLPEPEVQNPALSRAGAVDPLARQVRRGVVWTAGTRVVEQVLQLGATVVLARLLSPADYGLAALVTIVTGLAAIFVDMGIPGAVVQARRLDARLLATAFWLNAATGVLMALVVCAVAVPVARFFDEPRLSGLVVLASATFVLSLNAVHVALMQRAMQFKRIAKMTVVSASCSAAVTVIAAVAGFGASALVLGVLAQRVVSVVQVQCAVRWWPSARPSRAAVRALWAFGGGVTGSNLVRYGASSADRFVLGRFVDVVALGHYGRASNLMMLPVGQTAGVLSRVFFPAFAAMSDDLPRLRATWLRLVRAAWLLGLPLGVGLAVCAPAAVATLYGADWAPVVPLLVVLSGTIPFLLMSASIGPLYQAVGRTGLQFRLTAISASISIAFVAVGVQWGVMGVAVAVLARAPLSLALMVFPILRIIDLRLLELASQLWRVVLMAAAMGVAVLWLGVVVDGAPAPLVLGVQVATGAVAYGALAWAFERDTITALRGAPRRRRSSLPELLEPAAR